MVHDHSLITVVQAWRSSRAHLGLCRASFLVTSDSSIDSGRRDAKSFRNRRGSGAALKGADYFAPLLVGELSTGSFHGGNGYRGPEL